MKIIWVAGLGDVRRATKAQRGHKLRHNTKRENKASGRARKILNKQ
jgi:hypothetical protein